MFAVQDPRDPGITHVLVGSGGTTSLPPELRPAKPRRAQQQPKQHAQQKQQQKQLPQRPDRATPSNSETTVPAAVGGATAGAGVSSAEPVGGREAPSVAPAPVGSIPLDRGNRAGQDAVVQEADAGAGGAAARGGAAGVLFPSSAEPPPDREAAPAGTAAGAAAGAAAREIAARPAAGGGGGQRSSSSTSTVPFTAEQLREVMADVTSTLRPSAHAALPEAHSACNLAGLGAVPEGQAGPGQRVGIGVEEGAANAPTAMEIVPAEAAADATAGTAGTAVAGAAQPAAAAENAPQMAAAGGAAAAPDGGARSRGSQSVDTEQLPQQPAGVGKAGAPAGRGQKRARQPAEAGSVDQQKGRPTPPASPHSTSSAPRKPRPQPAYVSYTWLERCLLLRRVLPAADFPPAAPASECSSM